MGSVLRWGILGTGMIARKFAGQLPHAERGEMGGAGSRSKDTAQAFVDDFGGRAHGGYESLINDPDIDAVYVSLPNGLHKEWAMKAMVAGKHVLCEKPIANNEADARDIFQTAEQTERTVIEAFMYFTHPAIQKAVELVRSGAIGEPRIIRTNFTFNRAISDADARYDATQGGGALMDVGCYCTHLTRALAGVEPTDFHAIAKLHASGVDEYAAGTMRFSDTLMSTLTCGMTVESDRTACVGGTEGFLVIPSPWFSSGTFERWTGDGTDCETFDVPGNDQQYAREADAFAAVALDGAAPWITHADSLGNMQALDALRQSAGVPI